MHRLFSTNNAVSPLIARVALGVVIFPHGLQKTVGWLGGYGFAGTMGFLTEQMGLPSPVAFAVIFAESVGALLLVAGLATRVNAGLIGAVMVGAVGTLHAQHGFFMDWFGTQGGQGFEYHLLALGLAGVSILAGGGRWSVDGAVSHLLRPADLPAASTPVARVG